MKVRVLAVGRVKGPASEAVAHYQARAARYWRLEVKEARQGKGEPADVMRKEGVALLANVPSDGVLWALSRSGSSWTSPQIAEALEAISRHAHPIVTIVLGGAWGLSDEVVHRADKVLALGAVTLPHDLARLVLFEQLYRAGSLLRGEPYHKGPAR